MQQKEVLIVISIVIAGFFLLKGNMFSGQATIDTIYSFPQGSEATDADQTSQGMGLATEQCPPPQLFEKNCHETLAWPPMSETPNRGWCDPPRIACFNCLNKACRDFTAECSHYCGLDQPGAPKC